MSNLTVCCVTRNHAHYLQEWVRYHHAIGVDRFVMYLDRCEDNTQEVLESLDYNIVIREAVHEDSVQMPTYYQATKEFSDCEWLLFIDDDEFVYTKKPLPKILKKFEKFGGLSIYAKVFGPGNAKNIVQSRIFELTSRSYSVLITSEDIRTIKTFMRMPYFSNTFNAHIQESWKPIVALDRMSFALTENGTASIQNPIYDDLYICHYQTGSIEDWVQKYRMGCVAGIKPKNYYSVEKLLFYTDDIVEDRCMIEAFNRFVK